MQKAKIYSPKQVMLSTFLGGPLAMMFTLKKNFDSLGNKTGSKQTILWGSVFIILFFVVLPFISKNLPAILFSVAQIFAVRAIVKKYQLSKQAILDDPNYEFQSNWNVVGVSILSLILFCILILIWEAAMESLGLLSS